jgi:hypothetical protein
MPLYPLATVTGLEDPTGGGEYILSRSAGNLTNIAAGSSQSMVIIYFTARRTETITQIRVTTGATAAAATPTLCRFGVWTAGTDGALTTQVAATANDTTLFAAAATSYPKSFSSSFVKSAGTRYGVGILIVTGAAMPTFVGLQATNGVDTLLAPVIAATRTGQADLPASVTAGQLTAGLRLPQVALLP